MMPFQILFVWLRGLLSIALIVLGIFLAREWYQRCQVPQITATTQAADGTTHTTQTEVFRFDPGLNQETALLAGAIASFLCTLGGGRLLIRLISRRGNDDPQHTRSGTPAEVTAGDGTILHTETYGRESGHVVVLTHGLGTSSTEWFYTKRELGSACRVTVWDTRGLGLSKSPANNDYELATLAADLLAVARFASEKAGGKPVVLVGHSMGGMIQLELCKRFPEEMGRLIAGIVQVHTTHTNPIVTARNAKLYRALQEPLIEPLLHLSIWLSPVVRAMNALSYYNGSTHVSQKSSGFGGTQTYGQVDFIARYNLSTPPAANARVMLSMTRWDATPTLSNISIPALVVVGDRDPTCTPEAGKTMVAAIPDSRLKSLEPAKHYGMIEHHGDFNTALREFVERVASTAAKPRDPSYAGAVVGAQG